LVVISEEGEGEFEEFFAEVNPLFGNIVASDQQQIFDVLEL
jgi:hypothetical protein